MYNVYFIIIPFEGGLLYVHKGNWVRIGYSSRLIGEIVYHLN